MPTVDTWVNKFNKGLLGYRHPKICLSLGWLNFVCHKKIRNEKFVCSKRYQTGRSVGVDFKLYEVVCLRVFKADYCICICVQSCETPEEFGLGMRLLIA